MVFKHLIIVSCVSSPKGDTLTKSSSIIHLVYTTTVWFTLVCRSNDETSVKKLDELTCYKLTNSLMKDLKTKTRFIIYHLDNQYTRRDQKDLYRSRTTILAITFFEYSKPLKIHTFILASFNLQLALFRRAMSSSCERQVEFINRSENTQEKINKPEATYVLNLPFFLLLEGLSP